MMQSVQTLSPDLFAIINSGTTSSIEEKFGFAQNLVCNLPYHKQYFQKDETGISEIAFAETACPSNEFYFEQKIKMINKIFNFINLNEINHFLISNKEIISTIVECRNQISSIFGNVNPKIEVVTDAELPDWKTLFIVIPRVDDYVDLRLLDLLNWSFKQSKQFKKLVSIITE